MTQHAWALEDVELNLVGAKVAARVANARGGAAPAKGAAKPGVRVKKIRKVKKTA